MKRKVKQAMQNNKAVIYARFSSHNQREESIDAQVRACTEYAKANGLVVVAQYIDEAKTGTNSNRPEFQRLMADVETGEFGYLIVHKFDRFSRDKYDSVVYKRKLKENNIKLISVLERLDDSPESGILESLLESMAHYYSTNLAREVMKGLKENAYQAKHNGGVAPLGYDVDPMTKQYIINEKEAEIIKIIFEQYTTGHGYLQILNYLNTHGYKTKNGKAFGKNSLHSIIKNEKYKGVYVYNRKSEKDVTGKRRPQLKDESEIIRIEGGMPAIISAEMFDKAQMTLEKNTTSGGSFRAKENYLLSGLIQCGVCGSAMYGNTRMCGRNKSKYVSYRCSHRANHKGCMNKELRKEYIENFVFNELQSKLFSEDSIKKLSHMLHEYNQKKAHDNSAELEQLNKQLKDIEVQISNILELVAVSSSYIGSIKDKLVELEERKNGVINCISELTLSNIQNLITEDTIKELIGKSKDFIMTKNIAECRYFIESYIEKVIVYEDTVEVVYKINIPNATDEGTEPLTSTEDIKNLQREYRAI